MALWYVKVTFTGEPATLKLKRPPPTSLIVEGNSMDDACKKVVKFAKKRGPYWRFDISRVDYRKVL